MAKKKNIEETNSLDSTALLSDGEGGGSLSFEDSKEPKEIEERVERIFENYPTVDRVYYDEDDGEVYFYPIKENMTVIRRSPTPALPQREGATPPPSEGAGGGD